jgi:hypothetical protein
MSVTITTPDCCRTIRKTIKHLRAQTVREKLEIIIVAPTAGTLTPGESELTGFWSVEVAG